MPSPGSSFSIPEIFSYLHHLPLKLSFISVGFHLFKIIQIVLSTQVSVVVVVLPRCQFLSYYTGTDCCHTILRLSYISSSFGCCYTQMTLFFKLPRCHLLSYTQVLVVVVLPGYQWLSCTTQVPVDFILPRFEWLSYNPVPVDVVVLPRC